MNTQPFMSLYDIPEVLPEACIASKLPRQSAAAKEAVEAAKAAGDHAIFRVIGDCMERAGIEDGGFVAVDFTHMPRIPKYGEGGYADACLCLARWSSKGPSLVMIKEYTGKWGPWQTVSTRYAYHQNGEYRMDVGLFAQEIYGVIFASWGLDGNLKWKRNVMKYPTVLPAVSTICSTEVSGPQELTEMRI